MRAAPRTTPYSAYELRQMRQAGDAVSLIISRFQRLDPGMTRDRVRAILFDGEPA
ncbi:hypothetical protein M527_07180 [Sphingobium indicum IP26]|uniref:hypothetical protein n=1 Tax=Sphingobium TaxID=165695 RepID=UPI00037C8C37|nr:MULTISPECIES: hypothetical protein [Sphingobium]EPR09899.1 hypothetical protein M527_07180 [Sphingobium indicum IP26]EQB05027.1 hypothetical protein L286_09695 [Sphingobium sp. HDIP04]